MRKSAQAALPPEGFRYEEELLLPEEESELIRRIKTLPLKEFEFHGYTGKRRVVSFGWRYDFNERELRRADDIPPFLLPLRERAAALAVVAALFIGLVIYRDLDFAHFRRAAKTATIPG